MPRAAVLIATLGIALWIAPWVCRGDTAAKSREPVMRHLRVEAYDCDQRTAVVEAARGYAGNKRLGFLQTALIPTMELEEVMAEWVRDDGTKEQVRLPAAVMDWTSRRIVTPSGTSLFTPRDVSSKPKEAGAPLSACQD